MDAATSQQQAGGEVALHVVKETDKGLIVSGARILATLAPASDELFVAPSPSRSLRSSPPLAHLDKPPVASPVPLPTLPVPWWPKRQ